MTPSEFTSKFPRLPGAMPVWHGTVDNTEFRNLCEQVGHEGGKLLALWGSDEQPRGAGYAVHVALVISSGMLCLSLYEECADARLLLPRVEQSVAPFFHTLDATGGGWPEGIGYWNYGMRYGFQYLLSHERATGNPAPAEEQQASRDEQQQACRREEEIENQLGENESHG